MALISWSEAPRLTTSLLQVMRCPQHNTSDEVANIVAGYAPTLSDYALAANRQSPMSISGFRQLLRGGRGEELDATRRETTACVIRAWL
eukprot:26048-Eustigmatos_ZCMA.PRE.1